MSPINYQSSHVHGIYTYVSSQMTGESSTDESSAMIKYPKDMIKMNSPERQNSTDKLNPQDKFNSQEMRKPTPESSPPYDRFHFVLGATCLFGTASLLPWNFFITATDYWNYKFRAMDTNGSNSTVLTPLQQTFTSYLIIVSKVPFLFFLMVNTAVSQRFTPDKRIGIPLIISILLFIATTTLVYVDTDHHQNEFLAGTLCIVAAINVAAAFLQGGGTGLAGCFPKTYMTSNVFGQAIGGIFASVAQLLSLLGDSTPQNSAFAYFLCASITLTITLVVFLFVVKTPFYKYYVATQLGHSVDPQKTNTRAPLLHILKQVWLPAASTVMVFWVTLCVFPAVTVLVKPLNGGSTLWTEKLFIPVTCFLSFNICDVIGRVLATFLPLNKERRILLFILCCLRIVFVPLFMLCNTTERHYLPVLFNNDAYFIILIILMSITNGYLYTIAMTNGPKMVESQYQETAGSMMAFSLGLGLMLGSVTSYGAVKLI